MKVAIILLDGLEEIEALAPIDILRRAEVTVDTISITDNTMIESARNVKMHADKLINDVNLAEYNMIILPGGPGTKNYWKSEKLSEYLKSINIGNKSTQKIAAICAAPTFLSYLGMLESKNVTCFPACEEELLGYDSSIKYSTNNVVIDGNIITSKAAGTAIDFALELVSILSSESKKEEIRSQIDYTK